MLQTLFKRPCHNLSLFHYKAIKLFQSGAHIGGQYNVTRSNVYSCHWASAYLCDCNKKNNYFGKLNIHQKNVNLIHTNMADYAAVKAPAVKLSALDFSKAIKEFYKINMVDLKKAPLPAFWVGFAGLIPFILPPFTSLIFGYSPLLTGLQLAYGTALLSCQGGIKWGYLLSAPKEDLTWENYGMSTVPCFISAAAILAPPIISFVLVILGFFATFVIDLTSSHYPPWFLALRGVLTNISVFFMLITMLQFVLH